VHGLLTMKSLVTDNLGFAVTINALKPLLEKPNPVPISRWLTIGTLDPREWTPLFGGRWRQRSGRIIADGMGQSFGGRTLCLSKMEAPEPPYELAVTVKLGDEAGAAGLVFASDGGDQHYGFYPSGGKLRLTRFAGPDVYSWTILHNEASPHYRPGDWNRLKVRVEKDKIRCYVNDELAVESAVLEFAGTRAGLAQFRQTDAQFKQFQLADEIPPSALAPELVARVTKLVEKLPATDKADLLDKLLPDAAASARVLRERAKALEAEAEQLKKLAQAVHYRQVQEELAKAMAGKEDEFDLFRAGLLIARLDNEELEVEPYLAQLERMAREIADGLPKDADESAKLAAINKHLFQEHGFHGSRHDYYNRANSYLNEVLDDREGLPITLSVLYMELASRLGVKVVGIGLPGHFVVQHVPAEGEPRLIDVYEGAEPLSREEAGRLVQRNTGRPLTDAMLTPVTKQAIIVRMLRNLRGIAEGQKNTAAILRYLDTTLAVAPEMVEDRSLRTVLRAQSGDRDGALADIQWFLKHEPEGVDLDRVRQFRELLERQQ
jgi:regulator of sirC expression with transglutaminase-like and TPR domain